ALPPQQSQLRPSPKKLAYLNVTTLLLSTTPASAARYPKRRARNTKPASKPGAHNGASSPPTRRQSPHSPQHARVLRQAPARRSSHLTANSKGSDMVLQ